MLLNRKKRIIKRKGRRIRERMGREGEGEEEGADAHLYEYEF